MRAAVRGGSSVLASTRWICSHRGSAGAPNAVDREPVEPGGRSCRAHPTVGNDAGLGGDLPIRCPLRRPQHDPRSQRPAGTRRRPAPTYAAVSSASESSIATAERATDATVTRTPLIRPATTVRALSSEPPSVSILAFVAPDPRPSATNLSRDSICNCFERFQWSRRCSAWQRRGVMLVRGGRPAKHLKACRGDLRRRPVLDLLRKFVCRRFATRGLQRAELDSPYTPAPHSRRRSNAGVDLPPSRSTPYSWLCWLLAH